MDARNPLEPETRSRHAGPRRAGLLPIFLVLSLVVAGVAAIAVFPRPVEDFIQVAVAYARTLLGTSHEDEDEEAATERKAGGPRIFRPTKEQRAAFEIHPVAIATFRPEGSAEGRIALNDDDNVPVAPPYAGRVTKVLARAGDDVKAGDVLLTMETADMVQAQNDYQGALNTIAKATALLKLDQTIAARQQELFAARAVALKDYQSAQNDVIAAQSDLKTAEATLQAVRNRLKILGKSDAEITAFEKNGSMSAEAMIRAPIGGTIVQRKVGVGQYLGAASDPAFVIGDLSTVWLVANVRESEIPRIRIGQEVEARVAGFGQRVFKARVNYIAASLDPATRRLTVRSEVENPDRLLKPEMFATYTIITGRAEPSPSLPLAAIVYEGSEAHVWVARSDGAIEARRVRVGLINGDTAQIVEGLQEGEDVVTRGALFIDRAASGDKAS